MTDLNVKDTYSSWEHRNQNFKGILPSDKTKLSLFYILCCCIMLLLIAGDDSLKEVSSLSSNSKVNTKRIFKENVADK